MRFLILLFPVMVLAQPNFSISKWEYIRRIDNVPYLYELMLDRGLRNIDPAQFRKDIIDQKNLTLLQQLESEGAAKRLEKKQRINDSIAGEKIYLARKYLRTLNVSTLTTEEKKQEFFNAVKTLLGN